MFSRHESRKEFVELNNTRTSMPFKHFSDNEYAVYKQVTDRTYKKRSDK